MSKKSNYYGFWHFAYTEHKGGLLLQLVIAVCMIIGVSINYFPYGWIAIVSLVLWYAFGGIYRVYHIWKNLKD